jgi:glc operon protein GlcG
VHKFVFLLAMFAMFAIASVPTAVAQIAAKPSLNLDGAKQVIAVATTKAAELKSPGGSFAVVDDGGNLLALERLDGTFAASANIAVGKARTAALFKKPTKVFEEIVNKGRTTMVTLNDFTPLQGGVPIVIDGQVVGAIGVSGAASADQDEELAQTAAATFANASAAKDKEMHMVAKPPMAAAMDFSLIGRDAVQQAFSKGMPLLENGQFKIHASRRTQPGMAEVHDDETDIVYVVSGAATIVTGGTVVDPKVVEAGQTRGARIDGGQTSRVESGDVFVVPAGMPHWFKEVDAPFLYFVVKPISTNGGQR